MLEICEKYWEEFSVAYSPTKMVCVAFRRQKVKVTTCVKLCGDMLKWVDKVKHLGNHLQYNLCEAKEVTMKKNNLIQRVNYLIGLHSDEVLTPSSLRFSLLNVPISMEPKHGTSMTRPLKTFKEHGIAVLGSYSN